MIWILILYVIPFIGVVYFLYTDDKIETLGDMLNMWWAYTIPFVNILILLILPVFYVDEWLIKKNLNIEHKWQQLMNKKIK
jgi:hypothetical protein